MCVCAQKKSLQKRTMMTVLFIVTFLFQKHMMIVLFIAHFRNKLRIPLGRLQPPSGLMRSFSLFCSLTFQRFSALFLWFFLSHLTLGRYFSLFFSLVSSCVFSSHFVLFFPPLFPPLCFLYSSSSSDVLLERERER